MECNKLHAPLNAFSKVSILSCNKVKCQLKLFAVLHFVETEPVKLSRRRKNK